MIMRQRVLIGLIVTVGVAFLWICGLAWCLRLARVGSGPDRRRGRLRAVAVALAPLDRRRARAHGLHSASALTFSRPTPLVSGAGCPAPTGRVGLTHLRGCDPKRDKESHQVG